MRRLIIRRLALSIPLVFGVSALTFVLVSLTPGDPAATILGVNATQDQYAELRSRLGVDKPIYEQYWHWLSNVMHGSLGTSIFNNEPVVKILDQRLPVTLALIICTTAVCAIAGVALGVLGALRKGFVGRAIDVAALIGFSLPVFWLGLLLVSAFAIRVKWFPATGYVSPSTSISRWASSLVLPVVTLAVGGVVFVAKQTRDAMDEALRSEYVQTLRANGFHSQSVIFKHALRNAAIPVVTVIGLLFVNLLSGAVLVETVYVLPGLGTAAVQATKTHDLPVVEGVAIYFTLIVVCVNLLVDVSYGWLNPKATVS